MSWQRQRNDSIKRRNFVAKYAREFNHASIELDRKKRAKRGYSKHKNYLKEH